MNKDELFSLSRFSDYAACAERGVLKFSGFLDERGQAAAKSCLSKARCCFFGGYEGAERVMLCVLPEKEQSADFPIECIIFRYKKEYSLSHRDFLGTLMSLGLKREKIGDILVDEGCAAIFVSQDISEYIKNQIFKVGGVGVTVSDEAFDKSMFCEKYENIRKTIASNRLDCVVGALLNLSREKAAEQIRRRTVFVNGAETDNLSYRINTNDTVSIRQKGKYVIGDIDAVTKKGRTVLYALKKV